MSPCPSARTRILRYLVSGSRNKLIACDLGITESTVKVHIRALLRKLGAGNRTQAAIWAMNHRSAVENGTLPSLRLGLAEPCSAAGSGAMTTDILLLGTGAFAGRNGARLDWLRTAANARAAIFGTQARFTRTGPTCCRPPPRATSSAACVRRSWCRPPRSRPAP